MKKIIVLSLTILLSFNLFGCGKQTETDNNYTQNNIDSTFVTEPTATPRVEKNLAIRPESSAIHYKKHYSPYQKYNTYHIDANNNLYGGIEQTHYPELIMSDVKSIFGDSDLISILKTNGELYCIGEIGPLKSASTPEKVMDNVVAHSNYGYAITSDGVLWDFFENKQIPEIQNAKYLNKSFVITTDGDLYYMDMTFTETQVRDAETGMLSMISNRTSTPVFIADNVASVCEHGRHYGEDSHTVMFIKNDNTLWIYGANEDEYFYYPETEQARYEYKSKIKYISNGVPIITQPLKIMDDVSSVSTSGETHLVLKKNGELWGWGSNFHNPLGTSRSREVIPVYIMDDVVDIYAGQDVSFAIKSNGELWFCGTLEEERSTTPKWLADNARLPQIK